MSKLTELQLLQAWLEENALGQYYNACVANGYDTLKTIEELDEDEFDEFCQALGFLAGHRAKAKKLWPYISDFRLQKLTNQMEAVSLQKKEAEAKEEAEKARLARQIKTVQVYRYVKKPDTTSNFYAYYFSDSPTSFKANYVPDGDNHKSFLGVTADHANAVPVYASYLADSGFWFTAEKPGTANGWTNVGIVFYLLKTQVPGSIPIHRVAHKTPKWREYINLTGKSADGWDVQGVLGYGFPNNIKHDDVVPYDPQGVKKEQVYRYVIAPPQCSYYAYCITNKTTPLKPTYSPDGNSYKTFMGVTADTPNSVPIYVSHKDGAGFWFIRGAPGQSAGWNDLGVQFHLLKNPAPGTITIFKQSHTQPAYREIALATNAEAGGWTNLGILGYGYKQ